MSYLLKSGLHRFRKRGEQVQDFEGIYNEHFSTVYHYILGLCHDPDLTEEVTQESFFKAIKNIKNFRGDCKLSVWLCQIAKNTLYTVAERQRKQVDFPIDTIPVDDNMEKALVDKETAFQLQKILHTLNEPYKEVFWMRIFGDLSFAQIGELWGKSESWARVTYHRAKIKIKEELK